MAEINADQEAHGKKPLDSEDEPPNGERAKKDNTSKKKLVWRKKAAKKQKTMNITTA